MGAAIIADPGLDVGAADEIGPGFCAGGVDAAFLLGDGEDAVVVEQTGVAFNCCDQLQAVAQREERAAVGQRVGVALVGDRERRGHALAGFQVPVARRFDAGGGPERELLLVGAAVVAARGERGTRGSDLGQCRRGVRHSFDAGGIGRRADDHEIVIRDQLARCDMPGRQQFAFRVGRVHQQRVGVALLAHPQRRARADRDHLHVEASLLLEDRHQLVQQATVVQARGRGQDQFFAQVGRIAVVAGRQGQGGSETERQCDGGASQCGTPHRATPSSRSC